MVLRVADSATQVPGGLPGEVFLAFGFNQPAVAGGTVVFRGLGDQSTDGIYTDSDGVLETLVNSTMAMPGGLPGELFAGFSSPSISAGGVAFAAVGDQGTFGIYCQRGSLEVIAVTGTVVPGAPGEVFDEFRTPVASGQIVAFHGESNLGTEGIYSTIGGVLGVIADTATPVPGGLPGEEFTSFANPLLDGEVVAFQGIGNMSTVGLYSTVGGILAVVADRGAPVPGGAPGETFVILNTLSLSGGTLVFLGYGDMATRGIYGDFGGVLAPVADTSTPVPAGDPGELFFLFGAPTISAATVVFPASGVGPRAGSSRGQTRSLRRASSDGRAENRQRAGPHRR